MIFLGQILGFLEAFLLEWFEAFYVFFFFGGGLLKVTRFAWVNFFQSGLLVVFLF